MEFPFARADGLRHTRQNRTDELRDRRAEVGLGILRQDHVLESTEDALDDGGEQIVAIAKVNVEGAARVARAITDRVQARMLDAFFRHLLGRGANESLARLLGALRAGELFLGHRPLTYWVVCENS